MGSKLDSRSKVRGFESPPILDENRVKAMLQSMPIPYSGSFNILKEKNIGSQTKVFKQVKVAKEGKAR